MTAAPRDRRSADGAADAPLVRPRARRVPSWNTGRSLVCGPAAAESPRTGARGLDPGQNRGGARRRPRRTTPGSGTTKPRHHRIPRGLYEPQLELSDEPARGRGTFALHMRARARARAARARRACLSSAPPHASTALAPDACHPRPLRAPPRNPISPSLLLRLALRAVCRAAAAFLLRRRMRNMEHTRAKAPSARRPRPPAIPPGPTAPPPAPPSCSARATSSRSRVTHSEPADEACRRSTSKAETSGAFPPPPPGTSARARARASRSARRRGRPSPGATRRAPSCPSTTLDLVARRWLGWPSWKHGQRSRWRCTHSSQRRSQPGSAAVRSSLVLLRHPAAHHASPWYTSSASSRTCRPETSTLSPSCESGGALELRLGGREQRERRPRRRRRHREHGRDRGHDL